MFCDLLSGDRKRTRCFAIFSQDIANARDVLRSSLRRSQMHAMFCDLLSGDRKLMAKSQFLACRGWTPRDPQCASTIVRHRVCKRNRGREAAEMSFKCMSPNTFHRRTTAEDKRFKGVRSEEHTSELQSQSNLVCRLLLEKKKKKKKVQ